MRFSRFSVLPLLILSSVSFANSVPRYIIKSDGIVYGALTGAKGGRITFKAKEGATLRAYEDMRCSFSPVGNEDLLGFVVNSINGPLQSREVAIDDVGAHSGFVPSVALKTDWITAVSLPKLHPKLSRESHGKFRTMAPQPDPEFSFDMNVEARQLLQLNYTETQQAQASNTVKKSKSNISSNFEISLGSLPASTVSELSDITLRRSVGDLDGDGVPEVTTRVSPISLTIPASEAAPYVEWFNAAMRGKMVPMPLHIKYMDDDRPYLAFNLMVQPVSVDFDDLFIDPYLPDGSVIVKVIQVDQQKLDSILQLIR